MKKTLTGILRLFTNNVGIKILALLLSVMIWLVVVSIDNPVKDQSFTQIPVTVLNGDVFEASGQAYELADSSSTVTVVVRAERSVLSQLSRDDFSATIDMNNYSNGRVPITVRANRLSDKIVSVTPRTAYAAVDVEELGSKAIGISGKDGALLHVKKRYSGGEDIGYVGEITSVEPKILLDLLEKDFLPIVAPTGLDDNFETYNINADEAACAIAKAVGADKLVYLTDVEGLYRDFEDKSSFISRISIKEADKLISDGLIGGGMLPKLSNCTDAVKGGVNRVHILDGRRPHSLLLEIFTDKGYGTMFYEDN